MNNRIAAAVATAMTALMSVLSARADVYDDVLPLLRSVERCDKAETANVDALSRITVRRGEVEGAPANVADQAYVLEIGAKGVRVTAGGDAGERYARVTLEQLAALAKGGKVPAARVTDWPALKWRGVMNDCGRNYLALEGVKAFIDIAARYKMNLFHWHLSDYHGWRLESKKYPKLNAPETMTRQIGKFYTQAEFKEIVAYAKARGVTIMPELDVPGHTLALRKGIGVDKMNSPGVDKVVSELFDELCSLASIEDMPFVHLGTDEVRVDPEYVPDGWCSKWVDTVAKKGRASVLWSPGEPVKSKGEVIDMVWYDGRVTNNVRRVFDAARMYFASTGPERILNQTAFVKPCRWNIDAERKLGAVACCWHDDNVGEDTMRLFANSTVVPGILGYADNFWAGREKDLFNKDLYMFRLPPRGTDAFALAQGLERRLIAQRDKVLDKLPLPFPYVAQTEQRWRISWADGRVIDADYSGGLIDMAGFVTNKHGDVIAETWIRSDRKRTVGAWIGFTVTGSTYSRQHDEPTPKIGEWSKYGSSIEINGVKIEPPKWKNPGAKADMKKLDADGKSYKGAVYSNDLSETPLDEDWYFIREPAKIELNEGWNHVKLMMPRPEKMWGRVWRGIFRILEGTSEHPREVEGIEWSSVPHQSLVVSMLEGEKWWGVGTGYGKWQPFTASGKPFKADLRTENKSNQTAPLMVSSKGRYVWSDDAYKVEIQDGRLVFSGDKAPISLVKAGDTVREAFLAAAKAHFPAAGKTPDLDLIAKPQWNTWVELTYNQNQKDILAYARAIKENGFPEGGVIMIDDTWQFGYGVWEFDPRRFTDPKAMCDELHRMGYKVMLWVCPFVSMDCPGYRQMAFGIDDEGRPGPKGGLVCDRPGNPVAAPWWNGKSATIDFSDPLGAGWFARQLKRLQDDYGVDGWKLDAGDTGSYSPKWLTKGSVTPSEMCEAFAKIGLQFPLNEYRACFKMGGQPLVQRLADKDHTWKAVQALIPEMIAAGIIGHPFVCPDMIGSGSWRAFLPDAPYPYDPELFVRSAQVHALSPMMQFSAAPWRLLKGEHLEAVKKAAWTRMKFADRFVALAKECAKTGEPMLRNLEYCFPGNGWESVNDQFMIGDFLMVAPQVQKGARTRTVAVPPGKWRADDGSVVEGPRTITVDTPIARLPYFERIK